MIQNAIFENPIIRGFHPDPSICAVGKDFYLVNSTFSYFPGIPIFHSTDLVHWEQIGNTIDRESQVDLTETADSEGIYAPTIRFYQNKYYIISSNEAHGGTFVITAENPEGPWSDPTFIKDADGIDPSLYFENGKCYYMGTHDNSDGSNYFGDNEIYLAELDMKTFQFKESSTPLWRGALRNVVWPEGPHIYKRGEYYYLLIAEAGTESHHAMTIARSKQLYGPYEGNPDNPILTHRNLGTDYPIANIGHGDFVRAYTDDWYFVCLGSRKCEGVVNTGRETFVGHIKWEDDWPVLNPGIGKIEDQGEINLPENNLFSLKKRIEFKNSAIDFACLFLRNPITKNYQISNSNSLILKGSQKKLTELSSPTFIGIRQTSMSEVFEIALSDYKNSESEVGLAVYQSNEAHVKFYIVDDHGQQKLRITKIAKGTETNVYSQDIQDKIKVLAVKQKSQTLNFGYLTQNSSEYVWLTLDLDSKFLSTELAGGFTGCVHGAYITSKTSFVDDYVEVKYFATSEV